MKSLLSLILSHKAVSVLLAALLIFAVILNIKVFSLSSEAKATLAALDAAKAHERLVAVKAENARAEAEAHIASLNITIVDLRGELTDKDGQIAALTGHQQGLETALANAKTDAERVPILTGLVADWTSKFNLCAAKGKDYEGIIFSLEGVVEAKDVIIGTWRDEYLAQTDVVTAGDAAISALRADLRRAKFWSTVKSGVIVGVGGYVAYKILWPLVLDLFNKK